MVKACAIFETSLGILGLSQVHNSRHILRTCQNFKDISLDMSIIDLQNHRHTAMHLLQKPPSKWLLRLFVYKKKRLTHQLEPVTLQRRTFANTKNTPTVRRCLSSAIGSLGVLESQPRSYNFSREVRESDLNQYSKHQVIPQNPSFRFYFRSLADQKPCVFLEV